MSLVPTRHEGEALLNGCLRAPRSAARRALLTDLAADHQSARRAHLADKRARAQADREAQAGREARAKARADAPRDILHVASPPPPKRDFLNVASAPLFGPPAPKKAPGRRKRAPNGRPLVWYIKDVISRKSGVSVVDMEGHGRAQVFIGPRFKAIYWCRVLTGRGTPDIGHKFGRRDHTSIIYASDKHAVHAGLPRPWRGEPFDDHAMRAAWSEIEAEADAAPVPSPIGAGDKRRGLAPDHVGEGP
ncbi:MAG: hypothetical protein JJ902_18325 [Roseibium sp.]|nr:hypothetical protein [Roseibium sp.]